MRNICYKLRLLENLRFCSVSDKCISRSDHFQIIRPHSRFIKFEQKKSWLWQCLDIHLTFTSRIEFHDPIPRFRIIRFSSDRENVPNGHSRVSHHIQLQTPRISPKIPRCVSVVFSTLFSVFQNVVKHRLSRLIFHLKRCNSWVDRWNCSNFLKSPCLFAFVCVSVQSVLFLFLFLFFFSLKKSVACFVSALTVRFLTRRFIGEYDESLGRCLNSREGGEGWAHIQWNLC